MKGEDYYPSIKKLVAFLLLASSVFVVFLWLSAEPEQSVCGGVTALDIPYIDPQTPTTVWADAIRNPGYMQELPNDGGRFRYLDISSGVIERFHHSGEYKSWTAENTENLCSDLATAAGVSCRFFEESPTRYGYLLFQDEYVIEMNRAYVGGSALVNQNNAIRLEMFATSEDIEGAECEMARMMWILSGA